MYRDASNYKAFGNVIFTNLGNINLTDINISLLNYFSNDRLFVASQIRIPEVFLYLKDNLTVDDHCFHEYMSVKFTTETENDKHGRSINEFIKEIGNQANLGWATFDPTDSFKINANV